MSRFPPTTMKLYNPVVSDYRASGLILAPSLPENHIERSGTLMETSGPVLGGDVCAFQKQIPYKNRRQTFQFAVYLPGLNTQFRSVP